MKTIERVRRDQAGDVIEVMWRSVTNNRLGHLVDAPVSEVVEAVLGGEKVHVLLPDKTPGPIVRTAPAGAGFETIIDIPGAHPGKRLADLPTF